MPKIDTFSANSLKILDRSLEEFKNKSKKWDLISKLKKKRGFG